MRNFLTIKHWQLFSLLVGIPLIFDFILFGWIVSGNNPRFLLSISFIVVIVFMGIFFAWFYALGTNLYNKLPASANMNLTRFKVFLIIPVLYILVLSVFMFGAFMEVHLPDEAPGSEPGYFAWIIPVHLFSMFCIFYCLYFIAKALKMVEWQRPVTFGDYAGEFFLIWFFPIGIWIIQPRLNRLFAGAK